MKLADLTPDTRNANKGTPRGRKLVRESLQRYGAGRSILLDVNGAIIAGNKTVEAAKAVGMEDVQIVKSDGSKLIAVQRTDLNIDDKAARELAIADNRASELGLEWDTEVLKEFEHEDIDLSPFWDERELVTFFARTSGEAPEPKLDQAEALRQKWETRRGQIWEIGKHRLMCGDAAEFKTFNEEISACITDPPYGIAHDLDYTRFKGGVSECNKNPGAGVLYGDDKPFDPTPYLSFESVVIWGANCFSKKLPLGSWLVWDKRFENGTAFLSDAEVAWMKGGHGVYICSVTAQGFVRPEPVQHPTQKPVKVMRWCIEKSKAGQIVLDPFAGSGTTIVACEQESRTCYALEIEPKYVAVALERLSDMGLKPELKHA